VIEHVVWRQEFWRWMLRLLAGILAGCISPPAEPLSQPLLQPLAAPPTATDLSALPHSVVFPTVTFSPTANHTSTPPRPTVTPSPTATPPFVSGPYPIGYSLQQRPIMAYRLGYGPSARALIGGLHGGYEWNTVELMTRMVEYVSANPDVIPEHVTLHIVPIGCAGG
jgi:hypothetical protein